MSKPSIGRLTWKRESHDRWIGSVTHNLNLNGQCAGWVTVARGAITWGAISDTERGIVKARGTAADLDSAKAACEAHVRRCLELNAALDAEATAFRAERDAIQANVRQLEAERAALEERLKVENARLGRCTAALRDYLAERGEGAEQG